MFYTIMNNIRYYSSKTASHSVFHKSVFSLTLSLLFSPAPIVANCLSYRCFPIIDTPLHQLININSLLYRKHAISLPSTIPNPSLAESFDSLFYDKVSSLRLKLSSNSSPMPPHSKPPLTPKVLSFPPAAINKNTQLLRASPNKQSDIDLIPPSS